jgi:hypothetical protein
MGSVKKYQLEKPHEIQEEENQLVHMEYVYQIGRSLQSAKYFDYSAQTTQKKILRLLCLQHRRMRLATLGACRRTLAQIIGSARGLDINSPLSAETHAQDLRFHRHASNTMIPTTLGGSTTTSSLIVVVILRQQLTYLYIIDYGRDYAVPDKS